MEISLLREELEKSYFDFNNLLAKYIKTFNSHIDFIFSFSDKQSVESLNDYCHFSVGIADFYQNTSAICAKLARKLIAAYDLNDVETVERIDKMLKKQILVENSIGIFMESCENEITRSHEKISPKFLHNQAIELKQKFEIIIKK